MNKPIYIDYMSTTPVDPRVANKLQAYLCADGVFANPSSSTHLYGSQASQAVVDARQQVADLIHADAREIVFTSGATEANNLAIKGVANFYQANGKHIITLKSEHKSVLNTCEHLQSEGYKVTYLNPQENGLVDLEELSAAIREDTILISIMQVNNEIGVIQDVAEISKLARSKGVLLHVDATQGVGKLDVDVNVLGVDLMSFSGHKMYAPKGIGALYIRRKPRIRLIPLIHGGTQEHGLRAGTLPVHQIVAFGEACALAQVELESEYVRIKNLHEKFWQIVKNIPGIYINGDREKRIPHNANLSFDDIDGEALVFALYDIAVSTGSACTSASIEPSHVLRALGVPKALAHSAIRVSFGRFTTEDDVIFAATLIRDKVAWLRELQPGDDNV